MKQMLTGYLREDGRKGIRNIVVIAYLVECAHHVARLVISEFKNTEPIHLIGFSGCYPNDYADKMMHSLCEHPNVGAVLLVSLGCESFKGKYLFEKLKATGRPVRFVGIQELGGTQRTVQEGVSFVKEALESLKEVPRVNFNIQDLIIGVVSGGSDATSGITANPAVGRAFDQVVKEGGIAIFENTGEMIGLEDDLYRRAKTPNLGNQLRWAVNKAAKYYSIMGHGSFAPGNAEGGLTTLEEKSLGAYCKSGESEIVGLLKPCDRPTVSGLYLMDIVPDGEPRFGFPNPNDISEMNELIASGAHCIVFTTGRGSVTGSAIAPVIKVCANPDTYARMIDNMDINAGKILSDDMTLEDIAKEVYDKILNVMSGELTCSEKLHHNEFSLGYKFFEPLGPSCLL